MESRLVLCLSDAVQPREVVRDALAVEGFQCIFATCHDPIRTMLVSLPFSLILIDCTGGPEEAKTACRRVRRMSVLPILLLSEPAKTAELLAYLAAGANDYIVKPLQPADLAARVLVMLHRFDSQPRDEAEQVLRCCDLVVDVADRRVIRSGSEIELSPISFRLLVYFFQNECKVITRRQLLRDVWGFEYSTGDLNLVDSAIQRLRKDLGDDPRKPRYIHTVWGSGYRFDRERES